MGTTDTESVEGQGERSSSAFRDPDFRETLGELPPSAKLVAKALEIEPALSQGEIAEETLLPDRTVRYALNRLQDHDLVEARHSFRDARKQVYYLVE